MKAGGFLQNADLNLRHREAGHFQNLQAEVTSI